MKTKHLRPGLRTVKTGMAVTLAILITKLFATDDISLFYAALGAVVGMETTLSKSVQQGAAQLVGVLCGTVLGFLCVELFPALPPAWVVGIGIIVLILALNLTRLSFSLSLACLVFLWIVLMPTDNILRDSLYRARDTAVGIGTAILLNMTIRPYNNKKRILSLLRRLRKRALDDLCELVVEERYPDLQPNVELLRKLERELELYRSQRLFHRKNDQQALFYGCIQLAERMLQELEAIAGMDSLGDLAMENAQQLRQMGLELPEADAPPRKCTRHDTIVMNYHLEKLLAAYRCLDELLPS